MKPISLQNKIQEEKLETPYRVDVLIQGFPGRGICHGGLGWSTVSLIRGHGKIILLDVGAFGMRKPLENKLKLFGIDPNDVTDVILTHIHYDHSINFVLFPKATIWIGKVEIEWAQAQKPGFNPIPELYVQELSRSTKVRRIKAEEEFLPSIVAFAVPGHTPGHLLFVLNNGNIDILFTGDSAKNRAELISRKVVDTEDQTVSAESIELIWRKWLAKPGNLVIPGHDLTMGLDSEHNPIYIGQREASMRVWFNETVEMSDVMDLTQVQS
jgi:N-acyl homoserine lactone hydrolase